MSFHYSKRSLQLALFPLHIEVPGEPIAALWSHGISSFQAQQFIFKAMTLTEAMNVASGFRILPPIEVLGEPGDAYPRPSDRPTIGISRPLEPSFLARVGSEAWKSALRDDKATGADTEQWQRFRGHVAPYSFWTHFILSHAHDVVPIGPTEFASDLQNKLQSALSLKGGQNA